MFWQFIINGLITGVLYSLLAIGFALVYNTTRVFHIATGQHFWIKNHHNNLGYHID